MLALATAPILARGLGTDGRGLYAAATAAFGLAPVILAAGVPTAVRVSAAHKSVDPRSLLRSVAVLLPPVAVLGGLLGAVLSLTLLHELSETEALLFSVSMACTSMFVWILCVQSVLVAYARYFEIAIAQVLQGLFTAISIVSLWLAGSLTVASAMGVYGFATLVAALVLTLVVRSIVFGAAIGASTRTVDLLRGGARYMAAQVSEVSTTTLPILVAPVAIGASSAGLLSVGITAASIPMIVAFVVSPVIFGASARAVAESEALEILGTGLRAALLATVGIAVPLGLLCPVLVPVLFGEPFSAAVAPAVVMVFASPLTVWLLVLGQWFASRARAMPQAVAQLSCVSVSVIGLFFLSADSTVAAGSSISAGAIVGSAILVAWSGLSLRSLSIGSGYLTDFVNVVVKGRS
ncbi:oligosaccharide flippase family protein [Gordonia sp. p3-SID1431]|nr:oligosaccharide flippase family protein [Gordonia sp. p3-SID1431]